MWKDKLVPGWSNCSVTVSWWYWYDRTWLYQWLSYHPVFIDCMTSVVPKIEALPGNRKLLCPSCLAGGRSAALRIGWPCLLRWSFHLLAGVTVFLLSLVPAHESTALIHGSITHVGCLALAVRAQRCSSVHFRLRAEEEGIRNPSRDPQRCDCRHILVVYIYSLQRQ